MDGALIALQDDGDPSGFPDAGSTLIIAGAEAPVGSSVISETHNAPPLNFNANGRPRCVHSPR